MFAKIDRKPSDENLCFFVFFVALPIEIMLYNILDMLRQVSAKPTSHTTISYL